VAGRGTDQFGVVAGRAGAVDLAAGAGWVADCGTDQFGISAGRVVGAFGAGLPCLWPQ